jgi:hypothetical protein
MDDGTTGGKYGSRAEAAASWEQKKKERKRQVTLPGESGRAGTDPGAFEGITAKDMIKRKTDPYSNPTRDDTPTGTAGGAPAWGGKTGRPGGPDEGWAGPIVGGTTHGGSTVPFKGTGGSSSGTIRSDGAGGGMVAVPDTTGTGDHSSQGGKDPQ